MRLAAITVPLGQESARAREESPVIEDVSLEAPGYSREIIAEGADDNVWMRPRFETCDPLPQRVRPPSMMATNGAGPVNKEVGEIRIAALI